MTKRHRVQEGNRPITGGERMLMRKVCTFWLAAMAATVSSHSQTAAGQPDKSSIKVFILAGQSNMEDTGAIRGTLLATSFDGQGPFGD